jgi:hypothetical protein
MSAAERLSGRAGPDAPVCLLSIAEADADADADAGDEAAAARGAEAGPPTAPPLSKKRSESTGNACAAIGDVHGFGGGAGRVGAAAAAAAGGMAIGLNPPPTAAAAAAGAATAARAGKGRAGGADGAGADRRPVVSARTVGSFQMSSPPPISSNMTGARRAARVRLGYSRSRRGESRWAVSCRARKRGEWGVMHSLVGQSLFLLHEFL